MLPLGDAEITLLEEHALSSMSDVCTLLKRVPGATNAYNRAEATWAEAEQSFCGYKPNTSMMISGDVEVVDGVIRMPKGLANSFDGVDRIKLTHRYGHLLPEPYLFELVGPPGVGISAIVCKVKLLTEVDDSGQRISSEG